MSAVFVSGHLDLSEEEFELHYAHLLDEAIEAGESFVIGDARGADQLAQSYLASRGAGGVVYHMATSPRQNVARWPTCGGFLSDDERDSAMTAASARDIAWVRPSRPRSGTARSLARRPRAPLLERVTLPQMWRRVRSLRLTALLDTPDAFGSTYADERQRAEASWRERLEEGRATTLLVSSLGLDLGLAVVAPSYDDPGVAGLYSVFVSQVARGRGAGDRIVQAALEVARQRGFPRMLLDVGDHNAPAIALYARNGFRPTGRRGSLPPPREHVLEHEMGIDL